MSNILFDLDGTIADPLEGAIATYKYVFDQIGHPCPPDEALARFIGPPLRDNFASVLGEDNPELITKAIGIYRQKYDTEFYLKNAIYPGMRDVLEQLSSGNNDTLYVATAKPTGVAKDILDHFDLTKHFAAIHGNEVASVQGKDYVIGKVLKIEGINPVDCIMVGDRHHDVKGALAHKIPTIGVTWGYGSREELTQAGAIAVVDRPDDLLALVSKRPSNVPTPLGTPTAALSRA